jgi:putative transposase
MSRATPSYQPRLPAKDAPVIEAMKELSAQYPRYGYRRIRVFLRRRGFELSWSRTLAADNYLERSATTQRTSSTVINTHSHRSR